jgi:hypothetical protein
MNDAASRQGLQTCNGPKRLYTESRHLGGSEDRA